VDGQLANSLAQASQSVLQQKQKIDLLNQQLAEEKTQKAKLVRQTLFKCNKCL